MSDVWHLVCLECGEEFETPIHRGRRPVVCSDRCKRLRFLAAMARFKAKHRRPTVLQALERADWWIARELERT